MLKRVIEADLGTGRTMYLQGTEMKARPMTVNLNFIKLAEKRSSCRKITNISSFGKPCI